MKAVPDVYIHDTSLPILSHAFSRSEAKSWATEVVSERYMLFSPTSTVCSNSIAAKSGAGVAKRSDEGIS